MALHIRVQHREQTDNESHTALSRQKQCCGCNARGTPAGLCPYRRPMPRVLRWFYGGAVSYEQGTPAAAVRVLPGIRVQGYLAHKRLLPRRTTVGPWA